LWEEYMETGMEGRARARHLDRASSAVIFLTFVLFVAALLVKGFTHDLFLETGVLLVSVKLILNTYHMEEHTRRLEERIDDVFGLLQTLPHEHEGSSRLRTDG
jgi:hypothetical protein